MFDKFKDYYKQNKMLLTLIISGVLLFLSSFWHPFIYAMLLFVFVSLAFFNPQEILCVTTYYLLFSGFLFVFIGVTVYAIILLIIKYIIDVCKKKEKIYVLPLSITGGIVVVFSLIFYKVNDYSALQGLLIIAIFLFAYLMFVYRKKINIEQIFDYLIYGIIVSSLLGAVLYVLPHTSMFSFKDWGYGLTACKERIIHKDGNYDRLINLSFHENHLYVFCIMAICYIVYKFLNREKKSTREIVLYLAGFVFATANGILTMSKGFLLLFILVMLFAIIAAVVIYKKKSLKFVLPLLAVGIVCIVIFREKLWSIFSRFFLNDNSYSGNMLEKLTTGRWGIWKQFLAETFSTPFKAIFGVGLFTIDVVDIGPHNLYIAILYRFGIIGIVALAVLIWAYIRSLDSKIHCNIVSLLPLITFLILSLQEACLDERLFFLFFALMLAFKSKNKEKVEVVNISENNQESENDHINKEIEIQKKGE